MSATQVALPITTLPQAPIHTQKPNLAKDSNAQKQNNSNNQSNAKENNKNDQKKRNKKHKNKSKKDHQDRNNKKGNTNDQTGFKKLQDDITFYANLYKHGEKVLKEREQDYYGKLQKDKDGQFYLNLLKEGTIGDKISALAMIVQRNPQMSLSYLTTLINLSKKKNRKQGELAIGALKDLFVDHLLEDDNKLLAFSKNPIITQLMKEKAKQNPNAIYSDKSLEKELILAFYQHQLKELYREFVVGVLKTMTHDDLEFYRKYALNTLEFLMEKKPEIEDIILEIIVNKLGDQNKKVQCHTIYLLLKLIQAHPEMAEVIIKQINLFIQRPGTKNQHIYYAVAYLNQVSSRVAQKNENARVILFRIYFSLFKKVLHQQPQSGQSDTAAAAVTKPKKDRTKSKDQNKRIQKQKPKTDEIDQQDNKVAELVLKGVNILMTKCQAFSSNQELRQLIEEETNVLFKLTHHEVFRIQIQALKLLFQFTKTQKKIKSNEIEIAKQDADGTQDTFIDRYYRTLYEALLKVHLNKSTRLDEFFSLIFKSIKSDKNPIRVLAFIRRLIQMSSLNESSFTAACLLIISELIKIKDDLKFQLYSFHQIANQASSQKQKSKQNTKKEDSDDEDEEHFFDVDKLIEQTKQKHTQQNDDKSGQSQSVAKSSNQYDPLKREPQFANAESCPIYELIPLTMHTHPTVKLWAQKIIDGESITYNGDPLLDFGIANFLDRISYKNPKSLDKVSKFSKRMAAVEKPINAYEFSGKGNENDMPSNKREEEEYLYKYFTLRGPKQSKKELGSDDEEDADLNLDNDEEEDPELEAFANKVIEKKMKEIAGGKGMDDEEDESLLEELDNQEDDDEDAEEEGEENEEDDEDEGDFFDGEELSEVEIDQGDEDENEDDDEEGKEPVDDEEEQFSDEIIEDDDYGDEYGDEEDQDDDVFKKGKNKSSNKKNEKGNSKKKSTSIYADYEEFAHLLEGDLYDGEDGKNKKKKKDFVPKFTGSKRRGGPRGGGSNRGGKRPRRK